MMLAKLKTVVLIKEQQKLSFFRLVEYPEHQHLWVRLQAQNGQKLSSETHQSILVLRNEGYSMREIDCEETEDLVQCCILPPSQNNRCLASPQRAVH